MRVLITGVTGQDGWYLAEQHVARGDKVFGLVRGQRPVSLPEGVTEVRGDLSDQMSLVRAVRDAQPDVVYNLAAISSIGVSWGQADLVADVTGVGVVRLLEALRLITPDAHFVQASTADMFGNNPSPGWEGTDTDPRTPYGCAKLYAHQMCKSYREAYGMHISTAIFYSHTSPRQANTFIIPKVTRAAARIRSGLQKDLRIGNLDIVRDWGWAPDYMRALPLLAKKQGDYVVSTGKAWSLQSLCQIAFETVDLDWRNYVEVDQSFIRPTDVNFQVGRPAWISEYLGWKPRVGLPEIVSEMVMFANSEIQAENRGMA